MSARSAGAHPLHTTLAQLTYDEHTRTLESSIRVFAGDFASAVAKRKGLAAPTDDRVSDANAMEYVRNTFRFTDASGHAVPAAWCGSRRAGDVLWLCLRVSNSAPPTALHLADQMLCELFDDQINIVQSTAGTRHSSMLFTKGDGAKSAM
ncbi:MAG: DUF6702 family protein [Gemmatimonadota bacterium]